MNETKAAQIAVVVRWTGRPDPRPGRLMGGHPGAAKVQEAIGELDLAIRDFGNVLFDHQVSGEIVVQLARVMER